MKNIGADPIGKVLITDLHNRITKDIDPNITKKRLTQVICNLYPNTTVSYELNRDYGKKVTVYKGIYWKIQHTPKTQIDWTDIYTLLPAKALLISDTLSEEIVFALKSNVTVNGAMVMKEITFQKASKEWTLRVRGKPVNLKRLNICSQFELTKEKLMEVVQTVESIRVCTGVKANECTENCEQTVFVSSKTNMCKTCKLSLSKEKHVKNRNADNSENVECDNDFKSDMNTTENTENKENTQITEKKENTKMNENNDTNMT